ncbi:helix-turn-helix domain-containing protein [Achromobacter sp.]|uniref:helix-turn-helix domain-containing protein n=1 Tax=Achromobacter sp. TaxID=134375 RepID=UPI00257FCA73|nr:helix-turn-helix domain-containing protein [Achromobacter sp.]
MDIAVDRKIVAPCPTFSTASLGQWGSTVSDQILSLDARSVRADGYFTGQVAVARFHKSLVADVQSSAHRVLRTRSLVSQDEARHLKIIWQLSGRTQLEHKDGVSLIHSGEWAIYDTSRPYTFQVSDKSHFQMLLLPITNAANWAWCTEQVMGQALPGGGAAEVARCALAGLLSDSVHLDPLGQSVLQESVLALMGTAVSQLRNETAGSSRAVHKKLQVAQTFIEQNLTAPALTPDHVAQACGISKRSLYSLFGPIGMTPQAYITQRKLAAACELLIAVDAQQRTITQIAYELGFADAAHFSRVFSRVYGLSPSQWRCRRFESKILSTD